MEKATLSILFIATLFLLASAVPAALEAESHDSEVIIKLSA